MVVIAGNNVSSAQHDRHCLRKVRSKSRDAKSITNIMVIIAMFPSQRRSIAQSCKNVRP
ncbi:hypothetical protein DPMN_145974 [Dreissena polymorpha]|uniref:Uncharacterized protein n=1 Tax=Dreissena polymorpha TaxID=45954 RepID=A0A9D4F670_DREPO|nr:hypothetical protein DPMN_145974 [Dreissena polymorpha]